VQALLTGDTKIIDRENNWL